MRRRCKSSEKKRGETDWQNVTNYSAERGEKIICNEKTDWNRRRGVMIRFESRRKNSRERETERERLREREREREIQRERERERERERQIEIERKRKRRGGAARLYT